MSKASIPPRPGRGAGVMAAMPDNVARDGGEIAFLKMIRRLDPSELPILARYLRRVRDGMPTMEAARRYYTELGWSEVKVREAVARLISAASRRWQDTLD